MYTDSDIRQALLLLGSPQPLTFNSTVYEVSADGSILRRSSRKSVGEAAKAKENRGFFASLGRIFAGNPNQGGNPRDISSRLHNANKA
jgi:hypothetical protein